VAETATNLIQTPPTATPMDPALTALLQQLADQITQLKATMAQIKQIDPTILT
jgi:hypothetical protein